MGIVGNIRRHLVEYNYSVSTSTHLSVSAKKPGRLLYIKTSPGRLVKNCAHRMLHKQITKCVHWVFHFLPAMVIKCDWFNQCLPDFADIKRPESWNPYLLFEINSSFWHSNIQYSYIVWYIFQVSLHLEHVFDSTFRGSSSKQYMKSRFIYGTFIFACIKWRSGPWQIS